MNCTDVHSARHVAKSGAMRNLLRAPSCPRLDRRDRARGAKSPACKIHGSESRVASWVLLSGAKVPQPFPLPDPGRESTGDRGTRRSVAREAPGRPVRRRVWHAGVPDSPRQKSRSPRMAWLWRLLESGPENEAFMHLTRKAGSIGLDFEHSNSGQDSRPWREHAPRGVRNPTMSSGMQGRVDQREADRLEVQPATPYFLGQPVVNRNRKEAP